MTMKSWSIKKYTAVAKEIDCLLVVGFIKETYYSEWFSNVVLVKKSKREVEDVY